MTDSPWLRFKMKVGDRGWAWLWCARGASFIVQRDPDTRRWNLDTLDFARMVWVTLHTFDRATDARREAELIQGENADASVVLRRQDRLLATLFPARFDWTMQTCILCDNEVGLQRGDRRRLTFCPDCFARGLQEEHDGT